jgi:hypothetical protein
MARVWHAPGCSGMPAHRHHAAGAAHSHHLPQRRDRVRYVLQNLVRVDHVE